MFVRISMTTIATDLNSPAAAGRPPGRATSVMTARTRAASSASCPRLSPVRVSYRNGSSMEIPVFWRHEIPWQEPFLYSATRRNEEIHRQSVEMWTKDGLESSVNACPRMGKPIAYELASRTGRSAGPAEPSKRHGTHADSASFGACPLYEVKGDGPDMRCQLRSGGPELASQCGRDLRQGRID